MNISAIAKSAKIGIIKHGPDILTAFGTIGLIVSGIMAVSQTPKAVDILRQHEAELEEDEELTSKEVIADTWKCYLPSVILGVTSVASIIFARRIDARRMAAWAAAYQMSENALIRMKDAVKDELGEKKLQKIEDNADLKVLDEHPIDPANIVSTGEGEELFQDYYSGGYFRSSIEAINAHYNHWIARLQRNDYASVNSWVSDELGLKPLGAEIGEGNGFNVEMYQRRELDDEPEYIYGPGYLGKPCAVVKLSCMCNPDYMTYH